MSLFVDDHPPLGRPYWWDAGRELPTLAHELPERCDLLIVGAGYTGLSAAITAADAGAEVVVVDAGTPGEGASTRNGGMFGAHPRLPYATLARQFGDEVAAGVFSEAQQAFDFTCGLIRSENIDCDYDQCGRVQMAWTRSHFDQQRELVSAVQRVADMNMHIVERDALSDDINTPLYFGGIRWPEHASLQPRRFHDGLVAAVLKRSVPLLEDCTVLGMSSEADGKQRVSTSRGELLANKILLATNGYTSLHTRAFGDVHRKVFRLPSFIIATEPLPADLLTFLAPGRRMMVETRARHSYFRLSPDGTRILFGGRAGMTPMSATAAAERLRATLLEVWPELSNVKLSHSWSGFTGYSFTHMPQLSHSDSISYSLGYSGSGVALAPYLGMKAARQLLDLSDKHTAYLDTSLIMRPFYRGGKPRFLSFGEFWYRHVVDRMETYQARRDRGRQERS